LYDVSEVCFDVFHALVIFVLSLNRIIEWNISKHKYCSVLTYIILIYRRKEVDKSGQSLVLVLIPVYAQLAYIFFIVFNSAVFLIYKQKVLKIELLINFNGCNIYPKGCCSYLVHISANWCVLGAVVTCCVFCNCVCLKKVSWMMIKTIEMCQKMWVNK
jgi:hypothetical protein